MYFSEHNSVVTSLLGRYFYSNLQKYIFMGLFLEIQVSKADKET